MATRLLPAKASEVQVRPIGKVPWVAVPDIDVPLMTVYVPALRACEELKSTVTAPRVTAAAATTETVVVPLVLTRSLAVAPPNVKAPVVNVPVVPVPPVMAELATLATVTAPTLPVPTRAPPLTDTADEADKDPVTDKVPALTVVAPV